MYMYKEYIYAQHNTVHIQYFSNKSAQNHQYTRPYNNDKIKHIIAVYMGSPFSSHS